MIRFLFAGAIGFLAGAIGVATPAASASAASASARTLTVFAAASLHSAMTDLAARFEATHPGVKVTLNFAGSQILETQIANGAAADIYAAADVRTMNKAVEAGLVEDRINFAANSLVAIVQTDIQTVHSLRDLTHPGLRVAICVEAAPCGRYTRIALDRMSADKRFWPNYGKQVMRNVVTQELNVEAIVQKVMFGDIEAGFVYASDVVQKNGIRLRSYAVPDNDQDLAVYPIAVIRASANPDIARAFVGYVLSPDGQSVLRANGFRPPPRGAAKL